jgi:predicted Zn-ribbon and HTH transcriptional regulator
VYNEHIVQEVSATMPEVQMTVTGYRCARCQWEWLPRTARRPTICPRCKSPYWDRERERKEGPQAKIRKPDASND